MLAIQPSPKKEALAKFMLDYEGGTTQHPTSPHLRIWERKATFEVSILSGAVRLGYIGTIVLGRGHGTKALRWLTDLADKHGTEVRGSIRRVGREGLSERGLRLWYERHGFKSEKKNIAYQGRQTSDAA